MIVVLDASAAIEIVLQKNSAPTLAEHIENADWVIAPTLFIAEVTNVFWKYQKLNQMPFPACEKAIEQTIALPDDFINEIDLYREAFKLSCSLSHPVYDVLYLIVARRNNATLMTMDQKLATAAEKCAVNTFKH